ncbi:tigger transposable element-derived protein 6 [Patella vulgata]|uniref:tigger transposable element-derived protein 6 n=1 Tax=Patella vulgata TaxID=6465 RepID=UPI00218095D0|nr:tigger transposable element-derived protein 6 [Patella vulgata]
MSRRKDLTLGEKLKVIQAIDEKKSQNLIAQEFEVSQSTISRIAKNREHIINLFNKIGNGHRKRKREGKSMDVEIELLKWYHSFSDAPITSSMLLEKSKEIALNMGFFEFRPTTGWLQRWKERNNLIPRKELSESILETSVVDESYAGACLIEESLLKVLEIYQPEDIFNCKETGLYYNVMPECLQRKSEQDSASQSDDATNDRMTLLLCCNMAGSEKLKPLIICNNTTVKLEDNEAPVIYKTNNYGLMTTDLFTSWLEDLDKSMEKDKRQICMILNDCEEHTSRRQLNNVRLVYVPQGTTSFTHPLNHGIIQNLKALYRQQTISKIHIEKSDDADTPSSNVKLSVLDAIYMLSESWDQVKQTTVQNCFVKSMMGAASVSDPSEATDSDVVSPPQNMTLEEFNKFVNIDDNIMCFAHLPSPPKPHRDSPSLGDMLANIERKVKAATAAESTLNSSPPTHRSTPSQSQISENASPMNLAKEKSIGTLSNSANSSRNQSPVMFEGENVRKKSKLDIAHRLMNGEDKSSSPKLPSTSSSHSKSLTSSSSTSSKSTPHMMPNMAANPFAQLQMINMMQQQLNPMLASNNLSAGLNPFIQGATQNPSPQDALVALGTLRQYLESRGDEASLGAFYVFDSLVRYSIMRNLQQRM